MRYFVAVTDAEWFEFLRARRPEEAHLGYNKPWVQDPVCIGIGRGRRRRKSARREPRPPAGGPFE